MAQSSSLFGDPAERQPLTLARQSWTYQPPNQPRQVRLNDLVTVMVDEKSEVISEGEVDRRRKTDGSWSLKDWIVFFRSRSASRPDPQNDGDPTIAREGRRQVPC